MPTERGPDFRTFVAGLAASAAAGLQLTEQALANPPGGGEGEADTPDQRAQQVENGLAQARYVIDALTMLERKTGGNLTEDEGRFLKAALTDLRIAFVRADDRSRNEGRRADPTPAAPDG